MRSDCCSPLQLVGEGSRRRRGGEAYALVFTLTMGCAQVPRGVAPVEFTFVDDKAVNAVSGCRSWPELFHGALPVDVVVVAESTVTASRPVPLDEAETALRAHLAPSCADGMTVQWASAVDGAADDGVAQVHASAWRKRAE